VKTVAAGLATKTVSASDAASAAENRCAVAVGSAVQEQEVPNATGRTHALVEKSKEGHAFRKGQQVVVKWGPGEYLEQNGARTHHLGTRKLARAGSSHKAHERQNQGRRMTADGVNASVAKDL